MKLLVINGPNMNLLGIREPNIYGRDSYAFLCEIVKTHCNARSIECDFMQSNHEGDIIDSIQNALGVYDGIIINAAAYSHTSIAIADALRAVAIPAVSVHISEPRTREEYRHTDYVSDVCFAVVSGRGIQGYCEAADILMGKSSSL